MSLESNTHAIFPWTLPGAALKSSNRWAKKWQNQEMAWYDRKENSTGALCARLAGDASKEHLYIYVLGDGGQHYALYSFLLIYNNF